MKKRSSAYSAPSARNSILRAASRLKRVTFGSSAISYTYLPNGSLLGSIGFTNGTKNVMTTTRRFDGLSQMTNIFSMAAGKVVAGNAYRYNLAGQRTNCVLNDGSVWNYGYDFLGQVSSLSASARMAARL